MQAVRLDTAANMASPARRAIVHVVDARSAGSVAVCAASIGHFAALPGADDHRFILLGGSRDLGLARRAWREPDFHIAPIAGEASLAGRHLRPLLTDLPGASIVAWGIGALAACLSIGQERVALIGPIGPSEGRSAARVRKLLAGRLIPSAAWSARAAAETESLLGLATREVPVPVEARRIDTDRARLRWSWGASPKSMVVGLLTDPPAWGDLRRAAEIVGFTRIRGLDVRLVAHPGASRTLSTRRWLAELGLDDFVSFDERVEEPWRVVGGLDVGLLLGDGAALAGRAAAAGRGGLGTTLGSAPLAVRAVSQGPLSWATAARLPLVANEAAIDPRPFAPQVARFPPDDPLAATRTLLQWFGDAEALRVAGDVDRAAIEASLPAAAWLAWSEALGLPAVAPA